MVVVTRKINAAQIEKFLGVYLRQEVEITRQEGEMSGKLSERVREE